MTLLQEGFVISDLFITRFHCIDNIIYSASSRLNTLHALWFKTAGHCWRSSCMASWGRSTPLPRTPSWLVASRIRTRPTRQRTPFCSTWSCLRTSSSEDRVQLPPLRADEPAWKFWRLFSVTLYMCGVHNSSMPDYSYQHSFSTQIFINKRVRNLAVSKEPWDLSEVIKG